jgi:pimeloyl-ACP methyl ester carboxylesterase
VPGSAAWAGSGHVRDVTVAGRVWGQGPVVYLLHGWAGHRWQFDAFVEPLVARGLRVVAFDAPSHGESGPGAFGPRATSFPEIAAVLNAVVTRFGAPHAIVAHSAGAIVTALALCDGLRTRRLALLAPMVGVLPHVRNFATAMGFGRRTLSRMIPRMEHRVGAPMKQFDVPELGRATGVPPTLVIHDRGDRSTPVTDGAAIAAAWPGTRLLLTDGLGHNRLLRDPGVVAEVVDFVAPANP